MPLAVIPGRRSFIGGQVAGVVFSGTVTVDGYPAARDIIGYNSDKPNDSFTTTSDASGNWELFIKMGLAETAKIICVGGPGENSAIFDYLT